MFPIDGNETDILTLLVGAVYASIRRLKVAFESRWTSAGQPRDPLAEWVFDLSHGLAIYPMLLLSAVAFSKTALDTLASSNKVLMSLAGIMALVMILKRTFEPKVRAGYPLSRF